MKKLFTKNLTVSETRALINEGYKFRVDCDFVNNPTDLSGMTDIDNNVAVFTDRAEAEAFAAKQVWPFNPNIHGSVEELEWGETYKEMIERLGREALERETKKIADEKAKNEAMVSCIEEYNKLTRKRMIGMLTKEIKEFEAELAYKRIELALLKIEDEESK